MHLRGSCTFLYVYVPGKSGLKILVLFIWNSERFLNNYKCSSVCIYQMNFCSVSLFYVMKPLLIYNNLWRTLIIFVPKSSNRIEFWYLQALVLDKIFHKFWYIPGLGNIFCKGLDSKYFRLPRPYSLCRNSSTLPL